MNDSLIHVLYASRPAEGVDEEAVVELAIQAGIFNREHDITGCLWYHRRLFVQVLEGSAQHVQPLYERIQQDPRHTQVTTLEHRGIPERRFGRWGFNTLKAAHEAEDEKLWAIMGNILDRPVHLAPHAGSGEKPMGSAAAGGPGPFEQLCEPILLWLHRLTQRVPGLDPHAATHPLIASDPGPHADPAAPGAPGAPAARHPSDAKPSPPQSLAPGGLAPGGLAPGGLPGPA